MPEPRFAHDCDSCVFIGHYGDHDLYRCPQAGLPTIVARYGDDGPEYVSGQRVTLGDLTLEVNRGVPVAEVVEGVEVRPVIFIAYCHPMTYLTLVVRGTNQEEALEVAERAAGQYNIVESIELEEIDPAGPPGVIVEDPS